MPTCSDRSRHRASRPARSAACNCAARRQSEGSGDLEFSDDGRATLSKTLRRSILESRKELEPLSLGRPLTQKDIDDAIAAEMADQEIRIRKRRAT
jgi:hypothetical protein